MAVTRLVQPAAGNARLNALISERRDSVADAADELFDVLEQFQRDGGHPLKTVLRDGEQPFTQFCHYPQNDVDDVASGYAWYYHAHAPCKRRPWLEHGHFHCYAYTEIVPEGVAPLVLPKEPDLVVGGLIHLIALCMNQAGVPNRLFTINRWASDEWLYPAEVVGDLAARFHLDGASHSMTSRWLGAMLRVLQPQVEWLLIERDRHMFPLFPDLSVSRSEDCTLEVVSTMSFDLDQILSSVISRRDKRCPRARHRGR